jgi:hypothetical protein
MRPGRETARRSRRLYPPRASFRRSRISSISQSSISASSTAASIEKGQSEWDAEYVRVRWAVTRRPCVASPGAIEFAGGEAPRRYSSRASGTALRLLPTRASMATVLIQPTEIRRHRGEWLPADPSRRSDRGIRSTVTAVKGCIEGRRSHLPWLFVFERGQPMTRQAVNYIVHLAGERAKCDSSAGDARTIDARRPRPTRGPTFISSTVAQRRLDRRYS